jgi:sensor histidine kinase YesM
VPAFALQTLVENAVKHGIEGKRGGGALSVSARRIGAPGASGAPDASGEVEICVADTGVGIPALFGQEEAGSPAAPFHGVGLSNVADRLLQLYGTADRLTIRSSPDGTSAALRLPTAPPLD